jgi:aspartate carbamoyltransferase regulatory subunit
MSQKSTSDLTPKNAKIIPAQSSRSITSQLPGFPMAQQKQSKGDCAYCDKQLSKGGIGKQNKDLIVVIFRASLPLFFQ